MSGRPQLSQTIPSMIFVARSFAMDDFISMIMDVNN